MRTQTIYRAMTGAYRTIIFTKTVDAFLNRKARQWAKFERELLRRMDERDANAAKAKAWDALQKWKALNEAGFCSYYDLNNARDAADAAASEVN